MNPTSTSKKMFWREMTFIIVGVSFVLLGVGLLSNPELQERLGQTYTWMSLTVAAMAAVSLAFHLRERLFRRSDQ
jgi:hypothetical protein